MRLIDADELLEEINKLKESPWFNEGKELRTVSYIARKEAVETIEDLCIKQRRRKTKMNEKVRHDIFRKWINSNDAIETLYTNDVIDEWDERNKLREKLLAEIISTVKSEVEE